MSMSCTVSHVYNSSVLCDHPAEIVVSHEERDNAGVPSHPSGRVLKSTLRPASPSAVHEDVLDQAQRHADITGRRPSRDINPILDKVGLAMDEQRNVCVSDDFPRSEQRAK